MTNTIATWLPLCLMVAFMAAHGNAADPQEGYDAKRCEDSINRQNQLYAEQRTKLQNSASQATVIEQQLRSVEAVHTSRLETIKRTPPCVSIAELLEHMKTMKAMQSQQPQPPQNPNQGGMREPIVAPFVPPLMLTESFKKMVALKVPEPQRSQLLLQYENDLAKCQAAKPGTPEATTLCAKVQASADAIYRAIGIK